MKLRDVILILNGIQLLGILYVVIINLGEQSLWLLDEELEGLIHYNTQVVYDDHLREKPGMLRIVMTHR